MRPKTGETYGVEDRFGLFATVGGYSLDEFDIFRFEQSGLLVALLMALRPGERCGMMRSDDDGKGSVLARVRARRRMGG